MIALLALKKLVNFVSVTDGVLGRQVRQRARHYRHLAVDGDAGREFVGSDEQHRHDRDDHGEFDGGNTAVVATQFERPAAHAKPNCPHRFHCPWPSFVRFVLERGGRSQQPLIAADIRDIEAEAGDEQRPFVEQPHDDDVTGAAGKIIVRRNEIFSRIDRVGNVDGGERPGSSARRSRHRSRNRTSR